MLFDLPLHPSVVHFPVALIIVALLFDLVGRLTDLAWWRKAALAMLVVGALGATAAVVTGNAAEEAVEHAGVSHDAIETHEAAGIFTLWMAWLAVIGRLMESRGGVARGAISTAALVAHLLAAGGVAIAGHRGGLLVYKHGAGVETVAQPADAGAGGDHDHEH